MVQIQEMLYDAQHQENINPESRLFVAIAWSNTKEFRSFKLFPEVIHCDATCDTNNSKNHLITFTGRTSAGK